MKYNEYRSFSGGSFSNVRQRGLETPESHNAAMLFSNRLKHLGRVMELKGITSLKRYIQAEGVEGVEVKTSVTGSDGKLYEVQFCVAKNFIRNGTEEDKKKYFNEDILISDADGRCARIYALNQTTVTAGDDSRPGYSYYVEFRDSARSEANTHCNPAGIKSFVDVMRCKLNGKFRCVDDIDQSIYDRASKAVAAVSPVLEEVLKKCLSVINIVVDLGQATVIRRG